MKKLLIFITTILLLLSQAISASIYIIHPADMKGYKKIAEKIQEKLQKRGITKTLILKKEDAKEKKFNENDLTIFLGDYDEKTDINIKNPTIFSFTNLRNAPEKNNWSSININQPIEKILITAKKTIKKEYKKDILFIISEENTWAKKELEKINNHENIKTIIINKGDIAAKKIKKELDTTAAIVAIYDKPIWSGNSARWILQTAYNHKVPIIGYSKSFLKAGAIASVYSSANQIIEELEKHILQWEKTGKLNKKINYPEYTIEVNNNIAKALNLNNIEIIELGKKQ